MPIWADLHGQDRVIALLQRTIARDRVPHAYLFSGPPGAPLVPTALALASALSCQTAPGVGCAGCVACDKIASGIHPDVITLVREGAAQIIPVDAVRTQVFARLGMAPHEAPIRMFVVEEATAMAGATSNALLKTLEEPPARTLFVLCTTAPEQLLPTIRSRCQRVRFAAAAAVAVDGDPARAARIAELAGELAAGGRPGLAGRIAEGKGDAGPVMLAAAQQLHGAARDAAANDDLAAARREARRATAVLAWHTALTTHNANPQLAVDAVVGELDGAP